MIAVVGGGIAGMAAAFELAEHGQEVTLFEATSELSAKLSTRLRGSVRFDRGPDSYLLRTPEANTLLDALGLDLVHPATSTAELATKSGRRPIPGGLVLGAPRAPRDALTSALVARSSALRAALGTLWGPRLDRGDDLGEICQRRYGRQWTDRSIEPLVGGINANSVYGLSAATSAPTILHLPPRQPRHTAPGPAFGVPRDGIGEVVHRLRDVLINRGVVIRTATPVEALERASDGIRITAGGAHVHCAGAVLATPAFVTAPLVATLAPRATALLGSIRYASVSMLIARTPASPPRELGALSGILVDRSLQLLTTAVSLATSKWPHWDPSGGCIIRVSTGSLSDRRHLHMSDEVLSRALLTEARRLLDWNPDWEILELVRWHRAFPHFAPYHLERIARIKRTLDTDTDRRVQLAGAYVRGSGIPTCIATGRQAASEVLRALGVAR